MRSIKKILSDRLIKQTTELMESRRLEKLAIDIQKKQLAEMIFVKDIDVADVDSLNGKHKLINPKDVDIESFGYKKGQKLEVIPDRTEHNNFTACSCKRSDPVEIESGIFHCAKCGFVVV